MHDALGPLPLSWFVQLRMLTTDKYAASSAQQGHVLYVVDVYLIGVAFGSSAIFWPW